MLRTLFIAAGALLALLFGFGLLHPWLLTWVGPWALSKAGLQAEEWEVRGYASLTLRNVEGTVAGTGIDVESIQIALPVRYVGALLADSPRPVVEIDHGKVLVGSAPDAETDDEEPRAEGPSSVPAIVASVESLLDTIKQWLPAASVSDVTVTAAGRDYHLVDFTWQAGDVAATLAIPSAELAFSLSGRPLEQLFLSMDRGAMERLVAWEIRPEWTDDSFLLNIDGTIDASPIEAQVRFGPEGFLPAEASLESPALSIAGRDFGLPVLESLQGSLLAEWREGRYEVSADLSGRWFRQPGEAEPLAVVIALQGTLEEVQINEFSVESPFAAAQLSQPVTASLPALVVANPAELTATVDLDALDVAPMGGTAQLAMELLPREVRSGEPALAFALTGSGLLLGGETIGDLRLEGTYGHPLLKIDELSLTAPEGSTVAGSFALQIAPRRLDDLALSANLNRADLERWREGLPSFTGLEVELTASGSLGALDHQGEVALRGLESPAVHPLDIDLAWEAQNLLELTFDTAVRNVGGALAIDGSLDRSDDAMRVRLDAFRIDVAEATAITLVEPIEVGIGSDGSVDLVALSLQNGAGDPVLTAQGRWTRQGPDDLDLTLGNFVVAVFQPWFVDPLPEARIQQLRVDTMPIAESDGFVVAELEAQGWARLAEGVDASARGLARLSRDGLDVTDLSVAFPETPLLNVEGVLPVQVERTEAGLVLATESDEELDFSVVAQTTAAVDEYLERQFGIVLANPALALSLGGSLEEPTGSFRASFDRLVGGGTFLPAGVELGALNLEAVIEPTAARIESAALNVDGKPLRFTAAVELGDRDWTEVAQAPETFPVSDITGTLVAEEVSLLALARLAGQDALLREGTISADLRFRGDLTIDGGLSLNDVSTRPLPNGVPIREMQVAIAATGRTLTIDPIQMTLGGRELTGTARADFTTLDDPAFALSLDGKRIPLQRSATLILRSDLDLEIVREVGQPGRITGVVGLTDSLFLQNLTSLTSSGTASASSRPPFFAVKTSPWEDWTLDLAIRGTDFMRIQSSFFKGQVSADFQLTGTLGEPLLLGRAPVKADSKLAFPFGTLRVEQGEVRITRENPHLFTLELSAEGRAIGYSIDLFLRGTSEDPQLEFSSVPALPQEDIVLLLTAGIVPDGELGAVARAQRLALFLGQGLFAQLFGGGEEESIADRIEVRAGDSVSDEGRETYSIEIELTDRWSALGEYDRFDEYNVGAKYKIIKR